MSSNKESENLWEEVKILRVQIRSLEAEVSGLFFTINRHLDRIEEKIARPVATVDSVENNYEKKRRAINYIAKLLGGGERRSDKTDKYSLKLTTGKRIKIKFSECKLADLENAESTKVWDWNHVGKWEDLYDYLILVGETDPRLKSRYKEPNSPYILFQIPVPRLADVLQGKNRVSFNVNPDTAGTSIAHLLFNQFQMTRQELADAYA